MKRSTHSVLHMLLLLLRPLLLPSELWRAYNPGVEAAAGWLGTDRRRHKSSSCIEKKEQKEKRRYEPGAICTLY